MTRTGHKALADRINPDFCISEMFLRQLLFSAFSYAKMLRNGLLALAGGQTRVILFPPRRRGPAQRRRREWRAHIVPRARQADEPAPAPAAHPTRSEEHTSELQSLMRISYAVFCLQKKITYYTNYQ